MAKHSNGVYYYEIRRDSIRLNDWATNRVRNPFLANIIYFTWLLLKIATPDNEVVLVAVAYDKRTVVLRQYRERSFRIN